MSWREREQRRSSPRKPGYDYSRPGYYFVTARLRPNMEDVAEIRDGVAFLTSNGRIVDWCWHDLSNHYGTIELDAFVVMPDHIHGIIRVIDPSHIYPCCTGHPNLSEIVRALKTSSSRRMNNLHGTRGMSIWAPSFHDSIISSDDHLRVTRNYIRNNPARWNR